MQEFINQITNSLGMSEGTARSATGGLLNIIQSNVGNETFEKLQAKVPGINDVVSAAPEEAQSTGSSLLGGLMDKVGSAIGQDVDGTAELAKVFTSADLDTTKIGPFVSEFLGFIKNKAGADLFGTIVSKVPGLSTLTSATSQ